MKYRLCTYDLWGNAREGWEVNAVYRTNTIIEIDETTTDRAINRRLGIKGAVYSGEFGYQQFAVNKNGKPLFELHPAEWGN